MDEDEGRRPESARTTERVLALSDGVFAFALTLLALNIQIPAGLSHARFHAAVISLLQRSVTYAISVGMIGIVWMAHQRMFRFIKCYDHKLLWLNIVFLMFPTFIPSLTAMMRDYGDVRTTFILYVGNLFLGTMMFLACWRYAVSQPKLITKDLTPEIKRYYTLRGLTYGFSYLVTIPVAFVNVLAAQYALLALMLQFPMIDRLRRPSRA